MRCKYCMQKYILICFGVYRFLSCICDFLFGNPVLFWSICPIFSYPLVAYREVRRCRIVSCTWCPGEKLLKWAPGEVKLEYACILANHKLTWKLVKMSFFQNSVGYLCHSVIYGMVPSFWSWVQNHSGNKDANSCTDLCISSEIIPLKFFLFFHVFVLFFFLLLFRFVLFCFFELDTAPQPANSPIDAPCVEWRTAAPVHFSGREFPLSGRF